MPSWLLSPTHNLNKFLVNYFSSFEKHNIGNNTCGDKDVHNLMDRSKIHLEFTKADEMLGRKYLKKFELQGRSRAWPNPQGLALKNLP